MEKEKEKQHWQITLTSAVSSACQVSRPKLLEPKWVRNSARFGLTPPPPGGTVKSCSLMCLFDRVVVVEERRWEGDIDGGRDFSILHAVMLRSSCSSVWLLGAAFCVGIPLRRLTTAMGKHFQHVDDTEARLVKSMVAQKIPWSMVQKVTGRSPDTIQSILRRKLGKAKASSRAKLTDRDIGVLVTDHNVRETLSLCDFAYILSNGRVLAEGAPEAIVSDPAVRDAYLGESFAI